jgi:methylenetetrahydrofolate dehydrogenase (NADP+)/methenyltetrahydrofolate cyclohydrolase
VPALILDGRSLAADLRTELVARTSALRERGIHPRLVIVFVGANESSLAYVRNLARTGARVGIDVAVDRLPETATLKEIRFRLEELHGDPNTHGVMLQQPLPPHLPIREIADALPAHKDVDGTHPTNQGHLAFGSGTEYLPATPAAVMLLLERSPHWPLRGRRAAMIGRSIVVGAPVAMLMLAQDATVTILHKESRGLQPHVKM